LVIIILVPLAGLTAGPVLVRLHVPPPGQLNLEQLWRVDLNNTTSDTFHDVWLHGEVREARRGLVYRANTDKFDLPPGRKTVRYRTIRVKDQWHARGYEAFVLRAGRIPAGVYTYSVTLEPDLGGDTGHVTVQNPTPPRLVTPRDGDTLRMGLPNMTWTRVGNYRGRVSYELVVVELRPGQTKERAVRANPPWFSRRGIPATLFRYPVGGRRLEPQKRFAWQVKVYLNGELKPELSSEVNEFVLSPKKLPGLRARGPLVVTREVLRQDNWYDVTLKLTNAGLVDIDNIVVVDSNVGVQCEDVAMVPWKGYPPCRVYDNTTGRTSTIEVEFPSAWTLEPGKTMILRYAVVPILYHFPSGGRLVVLFKRMVGKQLRITYQAGGEQRSAEYPGLAREFGSEVNDAFRSADYLIATVPQSLYQQNPGASGQEDVNKLLARMARMAKYKKGVLGYSAPGSHYDFHQLIAPGGKWNSRLCPGWSQSGYLLLVGDRDIIPHWYTIHVVPKRPIDLSDHYYSDIDYDWKADLRVGRMIGATAADLTIPIEQSLAVLSGVAENDGSHALLISGFEKIGDVFPIDTEAGADYLRAPKQANAICSHMEYFTWHGRILDKALKHKGVAAGGAHKDSSLGTYSLEQLGAWLWRIAAPVEFAIKYPTHSSDSYFTDSEGKQRRVPWNFGHNGVLGAGTRAEQIEHDRRGYFGVGYIFQPDWNAAKALCLNLVKKKVAGKDLVIFCGHGSGGSMSIIGEGDVSGMSITAKKSRPIVVGFGCSNGRYLGSSISRAFLKHGAGAYMGATVMINTADPRRHIRNPRFLQYWNKGKRIGDVFREWKIDLESTHFQSLLDRRLLFAFNLYGDPKFGGNP
jgi:hypothetical protein